MNISNNKLVSCAENGTESVVSSNKEVCTSHEQKNENCNDGASNSFKGGSNNDDTLQKKINSIMKSESDVLKICQHFMACSLDKTSSTNHMNAIADIVSMFDDELFQDPPPKEECPICMLPMPYSFHLSSSKGSYGSYQPCCGKMICSGCMIASIVEIKKGNMKDGCAFCRSPIRRTSEEFMYKCEERMESNDAEAFKALGDFKVGGRSHNKSSFLPRDMKRALELWHRAAELGSCKAHYVLAAKYYKGQDVEKDMEKSMYHTEQAAMGGHEIARHTLGAMELNNGNYYKSMKHFMIAAKSGCDKSLNLVGDGYRKGGVTKDDYACTLRTYQQIVNDMKSEQRSMAADHWTNLYDNDR